ncbi:hypothetical protein OQ722_21585, partial [Mycobacterium ulcerans]|nr:hypothetical protein [Mycobacterium ulcerans]MEB4049721.1 hypothetical protein [Mycobacterium ulcerans]MEB4074574.1 hypothetical protein [Mycobacterium ulcerans]MEB4082816.1 hypothetical protein [Mycobacterium ulcerans]MEB4095233.1 hypothetical protein [Mycobacterium ulcerans]
TAAPIARHQRSSTQLTSLLINNAGALGSVRAVPHVDGGRFPHRCQRGKPVPHSPFGEWQR